MEMAFWMPNLYTCTRYIEIQNISQKQPYNESKNIPTTKQPVKQKYFKPGKWKTWIGQSLEKQKKQESVIALILRQGFILILS